jgi:uncharacterized protein (DUF4213/DUF364 family)
MNNTIQRKKIDYLKPSSEGLHVADVRIGLGYTSVRLDNGNIGLAWTAHENTGSCTHENRAGTLAGSPASELMEMLASELKALPRTIGLATANALIAGLPRPKTTQREVLDIVDVDAGDRVAMVGFFGPLVPGLRQTKCKLDILELETDRPGTVSPEDGREALASCTVAIITATSIVTGTFDELVSVLGKPRAVIMLGPSAVMCPQIFEGTPVTHIAGARVRNAAAIEKVVSEGGGTMLLKQYMDFETICL